MYSSKKKRYWIIFLLFSSIFVNAIDRASLSVGAPMLMKDLNIDAAAMGVVLSAFFWAFTAMNLPMGGLTDKFGAKKTLIVGSAIWALTSAATGFANNLVHIFLARIGVGVGESANPPASTKIINSQFPSEERGFAMGWWTSGVRLGFSATPIIMTYLMVNWGWRAAFIITGLGSLLWTVLFYFTYQDKQEETNERSVKPIALTKVPWRKLLSNRTFVGLTLCKFFQDYVFYLFATWLPAYLIMERGLSILKMGWYASLPWILAFVVQISMGTFSDWLIKRGVSVTVSRKATMVAMQFLASSVVIVGYIEDTMIAVCFLTLAVACESAASTILWTSCAEVAPSNVAGSVAGLLNTAGAAAGIAAPIVTGLLLKITGSFQAALSIGSCMVLLAAVSILFIAGKLTPIPLTSDITGEQKAVSDETPA